MSATDEDWLSNEKFDFDVTASPVTGSCLLGDKSPFELADNSYDDDEEVFFGPQTFKEKVAATVVKEKEADLEVPSIGGLNPEEQALILRESALLSLMIKHGTPNSVNKPSPIAVVHPMKRESLKAVDNDLLVKDKTMNKPYDSNKENNAPVVVIKPEVKQTSTVKRTQEKISYVKASKILQPRISAKPRAASNPEFANASTKLPMPKTRAKIHSDFSEPVIDQSILYGLSKDVSNKPVRRRSGLPTKQMQSEKSVSSKPTKPSMFPSAMLSTRMKVPSSSNIESKLKSVKATGIPSTSTSLPKSQLRLTGLPRKNAIASLGTPSKSIKPPLGSSSLRRNNSFNSKPSTPGAKIALANMQSTKRENDLITPVQRTPSARKSITGRQLIGKEKASRTPSPVEKTQQTTEAPIKPSLDVNSPELPSQTPSQHENPTVSAIDASVAPSHSDIMNRYKKLKEMQSATFVNTQDETDKTDCGSLHHVTTEAEQDNDIVIKDNIQAGTYAASPDTESAAGKMKHQLMSVTYDSPLLKLSPMKVSPVKMIDNFLDPFHTGQTPPPLIDIGDVLQPERAKENNLIEF